MTRKVSSYIHVHPPSYTSNRSSTAKTGSQPEKTFSRRKRNTLEQVMPSPPSAATSPW